MRVQVSTEVYSWYVIGPLYALCFVLTGCKESTSDLPSDKQVVEQQDTPNNVPMPDFAQSPLTLMIDGTKFSAQTMPVKAGTVVTDMTTGLKAKMTGRVLVTFSDMAAQEKEPSWLRQFESSKLAQGIYALHSKDSSLDLITLRQTLMEKAETKDAQFELMYEGLAPKAER